MTSPPPAPLPETDALADFMPRPFEAGGLVHTVHVAGSGPAVLVLPEMPGIGPALVRFARWVRDAGFRVHLPSLFGRDGVDPPAEDRDHMAAALARVAEAVFGDHWVDGEMRNIPNHFHAHARPAGGFFGPGGGPGRLR